MEFQCCPVCECVIFPPPEQRGTDRLLGARCAQRAECGSVCSRTSSSSQSRAVIGQRIQEVFFFFKSGPLFLYPSLGPPRKGEIAASSGRKGNCNYVMHEWTWLFLRNLQLLQLLPSDQWLTSTACIQRAQHVVA